MNCCPPRSTTGRASETLFVTVLVTKSVSIGHNPKVTNRRELVGFDLPLQGCLDGLQRQLNRFRRTIWPEAFADFTRRLSDFDPLDTLVRFPLGGLRQELKDQG